MRISASLTFSALAAWTTGALSIPKAGNVQIALSDGEKSSEDLYLIELEPGKTRWIAEDDKWALRRMGIDFMDITETQDLGTSMQVQGANAVKYPKKPEQSNTIRPLLKELNKTNMRDHLETFTAFHTRFYKSSYGVESSNWLLEKVNETVAESGALDHGATVLPFEHSWGQSSVIAKFPGKSNKTIVIGAHQDSINLFMPWFLAAPGADDDGSGTVTIWEALRVLLQNKDIVKGKAPNTVEFHWYSAEEGGLLGSQAIFQVYEKEGRDIKAMFHQDMTGYVEKTLEAGEPESFGVITDFVDPNLTEFIMKVIEEYCDIPYVMTKCGYACSDHASAFKAGYPAAFVIESDFKYSDKKIHTTEDKIEYLSFSHMLQHAKLTLSLVSELAYANFD